MSFDGSLKLEVELFLRKNVIGRTLHTSPVEYELEGGRLRGIYFDTMQFSDLAASETGLQFHMTTVTVESVYEGDQLLRDYAGTSVFLYKLAMRRSTGQMTGFMQVVSTTVREQTMEAVVYGVSDVRIESGALRWSERQLMYRDSPAGEGHYNPVAFDAEIAFRLENGKAVFEYAPAFWDVDPLTMEKISSEDRYPPFVSREK